MRKPGPKLVKLGIRKPSIKRRVAARTSWKRQVRHRGALKSRRGMGWAMYPKKATYNRAYNRTSVSADWLFKKRQRARSKKKTDPFNLAGRSGLRAGL
ncbi:MAG: hypothetical protein LAT83_12100 [Kiritimatiellae bacterium]|nr:hypothetical protein [Kiritimatiellia bacterium]